MIIPVRCFTCGKVLANKYEYFLAEVKKQKMANEMQVDKVIYLTRNFADKTPEGIVLDTLQLNKPCCRRHMLTHVNIQ